MTSGDDTPIDGRRARRERSRVAVVDAVFALVRDGKIPPTAEDVAARAGVSVSSVFRNFDGLDDMQRQAFDVFSERFAHLFEVAALRDVARADRIGGHVRARLELFETAGPMMYIARHRALDHQPMADAVGRNRLVLADQTRANFAPEVGQLTPSEAANLVAVIDSLTSPEAYEVMGAANSRSHRQIGRAWTTALTSLLASWPNLTEPTLTQETPS
jgi:TetR/AcrR family transcriptional regulator of autoinduction and epiphytic fitness